MASENLTPAVPAFSTDHPVTTNLDLLNRAKAGLSPADAEMFLSYFLGAVSVFTPSEEWVRSLKTASICYESLAHCLGTVRSKS